MILRAGKESIQEQALEVLQELINVLFYDTTYYTVAQHNGTVERDFM